jgi:hypothetical protein
VCAPNNCADCCASPAGSLAAGRGRASCGHACALAPTNGVPAQVQRVRRAPTGAQQGATFQGACSTKQENAACGRDSRPHASLHARLYVCLPVLHNDRPSPHTARCAATARLSSGAAAAACTPSGTRPAPAHPPAAVAPTDTSLKERMHCVASAQASSAGLSAAFLSAAVRISRRAARVLFALALALALRRRAAGRAASRNKQRSRSRSTKLHRSSLTHSLYKVRARQRPCAAPLCGIACHGAHCALRAVPSRLLARRRGCRSRTLARARLSHSKP